MHHSNGTSKSAMPAVRWPALSSAIRFMRARARSCLFASLCVHACLRAGACALECVACGASGWAVCMPASMQWSVLVPNQRAFRRRMSVPVDFRYTCARAKPPLALKNALQYLMSQSRPSPESEPPRPPPHPSCTSSPLVLRSYQAVAMADQLHRRWPMLTLHAYLRACTHQ